MSSTSSVSLVNSHTPGHSKHNRSLFLFFFTWILVFALLGSSLFPFFSTSLSFSSLSSSSADFSFSRLGYHSITTVPSSSLSFPSSSSSPSSPSSPSISSSPFSFLSTSRRAASLLSFPYLSLSPQLSWKFSTSDKIYASVAVAFLNASQDRSKTIILGSTDNYVYFLDGEKGEVKSKFHAPQDISVSPSLGDLNHDGALETVICSENGDIYAFYSNGSLWWELATADKFSFVAPMIGNINLDSHLEVVVGSLDGTLYAVSHEGKLLWNQEVGGSLTSAALGDIDRDGISEVVVGSSEGKVVILDGQTGTPARTISTSGGVTGIALFSPFHNQTLQVLAVTSTGHVSLYATDGELLWDTVVGTGILSSPAIGDLNLDGDLEIVVGTQSEQEIALHAVNGSAFWSFDASGEVFSPVIGDISGDGYPEVIFGTRNDILYAVDGQDGSLLWQFEANGDIIAAPCLEDLDGDQQLELLFTSVDSSLYVLDFPGISRSFLVLWQGESGSLNYSRTRNQFLVDPDADYLASSYEVEIGTNPFSNDTDGDGLLDWNELQWGTDATAMDTDSDGVWDGVELENNMNPLDPDTDHDGVPDGAELYQFHSNPLLNDTDSDGLPDGWEAAHGLILTFNDTGFDLDQDGLTNLEEYVLHTGPDHFDTDMDGLKDKDELVTYQTDPLLNDTDNDGLEDGYEVFISFTSPLKPDTDGDGLPDLWELVYHFNASDPSDASLDPDQDGVTNLEEYRHGTHPFSSDTDQDGLSDGEEIQEGLNPLSSDTDSDGYSDSQERKYLVIAAKTSWLTPVYLKIALAVIIFFVGLLSVFLLWKLLVRLLSWLYHFMVNPIKQAYRKKQLISSKIKSLQLSPLEAKYFREYAKKHDIRNMKTLTPAVYQTRLRGKTLLEETLETLLNKESALDLRDFAESRKLSLDLVRKTAQKLTENNPQYYLSKDIMVFVDEQRITMLILKANEKLNQVKEMINSETIPKDEIIRHAVRLRDFAIFFQEVGKQLNIQLLTEMGNTIYEQSEQFIKNLQ